MGRQQSQCKRFLYPTKMKENERKQMEQIRKEISISEKELSKNPKNETAKQNIKMLQTVLSNYEIEHKITWLKQKFRIRHQTG